jgi:hypothetical protein
MPMGIITLEDVLEELIGEEIYDEFDAQGAHGDPYQIPEPVLNEKVDNIEGGVPIKAPKAQHPSLRQLKSLGFLRSRSAPPVRRGVRAVKDTAPKVDGLEEGKEYGGEAEELAPSYTAEETQSESEGDDLEDLTNPGRPQRGLSRLASSAPATRAPSPSNLGVSTSLPSSQLLQRPRNGSTPPSRCSLDGGIAERVRRSTPTSGVWGTGATARNLGKLSGDIEGGGQEDVNGPEPFSRGGQRGMAFKSRPVSPAGDQQAPIEHHPSAAGPDQE